MAMIDLGNDVHVRHDHIVQVRSNSYRDRIYGGSNTEVWLADGRKIGSSVDSQVILDKIRIEDIPRSVG